MKQLPMDKPVHYIIWRFGIGGIELGINHFVKAYSQHRKLYVYGLRATRNSIYDESKIEVHMGGLQKVKTYLDYFKYCRRHKKDIFHLLNTGPIILLLTLLAGARNPLYHIRGTVYWKNNFQKLYLKPAWYLSWLLSGITGKINFVCNSSHSIGIFKHQALSLQPELIYNGFEVETFLEKRHLRRQLKRLAYIGRLSTGKNVHLVIRLFDHIAGNHPELELHIAGTGPLLPELELQAQKSRHSERIVFHGLVEDMPAFYASVDLFLFLSAYESFGNVLPEALLTGLPILTSNVPVFQEIHNGEKAFLLGDPNDFTQLEKNLTKAIQHYPELAQKAFEKSEYIHENFNIQQHVSAIEKIYDKLS